METPIKQQLLQLVSECQDIHQLQHIKLLLEQEATTASMVQEPTVRMAELNIKQVQKDITALVEHENDADFLQYIKNELDPNYVHDFFDDLSPEDKAELLELIDEPDDKDIVTHEEFLQATARWRTK